jgi:cyclohexanone monooxygenase
LSGKHPPIDAVVVGAGFSGLYMLHRLSALGMRVRGFEAGSDVGGTWFWNRYPGARCDVESLDYSFSFSNELQQDWRWSLKYAEQAEILRYLNHVADRFALRRLIQFNTRIVSQHYDEGRHAWTIETDGGERISARFCVMATGNLSTPRVPDFPGLERFKGTWHHSGLWPAEGVDFSGQRVGLIGTGATGIQMVPVIARQAAHLYVFQRTANFSVPARNAELDPDTDRRHKANYPERRRYALQTSVGISGLAMPAMSALEVLPDQRQRIYQDNWDAGGSAYFLTAFTDLMLDQAANDTAAAFVREKIHELVRDPTVADLLSPHDHPIGTKRLCVDTDYYETFNRGNVSLVDARRAPIQEITETGIKTADAEYAVDTLVFATGFDAMTGALREIDIRGRDGRTLASKWAAGPTTYLGLMVAGFPNLFIVTGPGSPSVKTNMVCSIEQHVEWIAECLAFLQSRQIVAIEPEKQAEQDWVAHVNAVADRTLFPKADSWYSGSNIPGKPRVFMPYVAGIPAYRAVCDAVVSAGYRGFVLTGAEPLGSAAIATHDLEWADSGE